MDARRQDLTNSIGLLILRLGFGVYMACHGWMKVKMVFNGQFEMMGDPIGLGPHLSLILVAFAEFVCALLVVFGVATRFAAAPVVFAMGVAAFVAHGSDPWTMGAGASKQPALMFLAAFAALIFTGPGKLSFDGLMWGRVLAWRAKRKLMSKGAQQAQAKASAAMK